MATIYECAEVQGPLPPSYNQWTQFEEFPQCMECRDALTQLDDTHVRWVAEIAGKRHEWEAEITEQRPDERVAWRARDGKANGGVVTFHRLNENRTRIMVQMDYETEGVVEAVGSAVGADERRVKGDLERFKELIESRGRESGAWRGEVEQGSVS